MACNEQYTNEATIKLCNDEDRLYEIANNNIENFKDSFSDYIRGIHNTPQSEKIRSDYAAADEALNQSINNYKDLAGTIKARISSNKTAMQNQDARFDYIKHEISQKKRQYKKDYHSHDASTTLKKDIHKSKRYTFFNLGYYSIGTGLLIYFLYKQIKN